jgi:hypothetical protein
MRNEPGNVIYKLREAGLLERAVSTRRRTHLEVEREIRATWTRTWERDGTTGWCPLLTVCIWSQRVPKYKGSLVLHTFAYWYHVNILPASRGALPRWWHQQKLVGIVYKGGEYMPQRAEKPGIKGWTLEALRPISEGRPGSD